MKRQFAVIGLGRFGYSVAETLVKSGCEVLAIDLDEAKVQSISDLATFAVQCDATDERALKTVSTQNVDVAVVSIGEDIEASILIVQTLKEMGVKSIIAKAVTNTHGKILTNLGVNEVIYPERDAAVRLVHRLVSPNVLEYLELAPGYSIEEITVPDRLAGLRLGEALAREQHKFNVIGIKKQVTRMVKGRMMKEEVFNFTPSLEEAIEKGDVLVVIGKVEDLDRFSNGG
ncbi:MAG TPA: TrkA family potassium uptake protein [Nitrospiraceae bacterium]|nr:TrkA family potassium uptake protein [Nitrospiraceae bacterium]